MTQQQLLFADPPAPAPAKAPKATEGDRRKADGMQQCLRCHCERGSVREYAMPDVRLTINGRPAMLRIGEIGFEILEQSGAAWKRKALINGPFSLRRMWQFLIGNSASIELAMGAPKVIKRIAGRYSLSQSVA